MATLKKHHWSWLLPLFLCSCQTLAIKKVTRLPALLHETSGLVAVSDSLFWSHNDGGNAPKLYQFDRNGKIVREATVKTTNKDWEELFLDGDGHLYIADFGNNAQIRQDLAIFKIPNFATRLRDTVFEVEKIAFFYPEQKAFPPPPAQKVFDAEAMIVRGDSIYIFTKDFYSQPYAGVTHIYSVPNQPTSNGAPHSAKLKTVLQTDGTSNMHGAITAAAINTEGVGQNGGDGVSNPLIVLLAYRRLYVIENFFNPRQNLDVKMLKISRLNTAQREAISIGRDNTLYITSEKTRIIGGNLSRVRRTKYLRRAFKKERIER